MQGRLKELREQLVVNILVSLREQIVSIGRQQSFVSDEVSSVKQSAQSLGKEFLKRVDDESDELRWERDLIKAIYRSHSEDHTGDSLAKESSNLLSEVDRGKVSRFTGGILAALRYGGMTDRDERIVEAHKDTFEWIYRESGGECQSWTNFAGWLESSSLLYWITGKAGAGKSTLMKYIYQDSRTQELLQKWSRSDQLVSAAFFFWNSGTQLQMSKEGLLRSLLYQALCQCKDLVPRVFPGLWEAYSLFNTGTNFHWTWPELLQAFRLLIEGGRSNRKFCFVIDGLDEFDGDLADLVMLFKKINSSSPYVKLCVSSRPWVVFEDALKNKPMLRLEDLTYSGIQLFVTTKLHESSGFNELDQQEPEYAKNLIDEIVVKSSGVFLWVDLVVKSLVTGLTNGDRISDLQRRLESLPADLEELFRKILDYLDPIYIGHASQLFQLVRSSVHPPSLLCMSFADEESADAVFKFQIQPLEPAEILYRAQTMKRRINSRCKGLLEIARYSAQSATEDDGSSVGDSTVEYLHRTVKDFLERPEIWNRILAATGTSFNPQVSLCRSFLMQLKCVPQDSSLQKNLWDRVTWCIQHAWEAERTNGGAQVRILEEVDRAASQVSPSWLSQRHGQGHNCDFLYLATECQLSSYLEAKLDHQCTSFIPVLLKAAVLEYRVFPELGDRPACKRRIPSPKVVQLLLERGGDPNTLWEDILDWAPKQPTIENQAWMEIMKLFLDHGANPWVKELDFPVLGHRKLADMVKEKRRWYQLSRMLNSLFRQPRSKVVLL